MIITKDYYTGSNKDKMEKLCIVMPAYNEAANIENVIKEWHSILYDKDAGSNLVINCSGSNDGTVEEIERLQGTYSNIEIISDSENSYGSKVLDLYRYAVSRKYDYVFQTDSDGQTSTDDFEQFWNQRRSYDALIGNRQHRSDGPVRRAVQVAECAFIKRFFHTSVPDANTPFRLFKTELLEKYLNIIPDDYSMPNLIMTACIAANGEKLKFIPISFGARQGGTNKMNLKKIFKCGIESVDAFRETAMLIKSSENRNGAKYK